MRHSEAFAEAQRRWGEVAAVRDRVIDHPLARQYVVGIISNPERNNMLVYGEGPTWEAAFSEATERSDFLKPYLEDALQKV